VPLNIILSVVSTALSVLKLWYDKSRYERAVTFQRRLGTIDLSLASFSDRRISL
jgi:hypothetical protein